MSRISKIVEAIRICSLAHGSQIGIDRGKAHARNQHTAVWFAPRRRIAAEAGKNNTGLACERKGVLRSRRTPSCGLDYFSSSALM
jgi:hypothetical protein